MYIGDISIFVLVSRDFKVESFRLFVLTEDLVIEDMNEDLSAPAWF